MVILKFGQLTMRSGDIISLTMRSVISKPYQFSDLISKDIRTVDTAPDWIIANLGTVRQGKQRLCHIDQHIVIHPFHLQ